MTSRNNKLQQKSVAKLQNKFLQFGLPLDNVAHLLSIYAENPNIPSMLIFDLLEIIYMIT